MISFCRLGGRQYWDHQRLGAFKGLCVGRPAFHTPQSGQPKKHLIVPPVSTTLGREALVQELDLMVRRLRRERDVDGWTAQISIPLRDLVSQIEDVAKYGGQQLTDNPVILVGIVARWPDDQVRLAHLCEVFEGFLHRPPHRREPAVRQTVQIDSDVSSRKEAMGRRPGLELTLCGTCQHDVSNLQFGLSLGQGKQGAACSDFDVIGVSPDSEDRQRTILGVADAQ